MLINRPFAYLIWSNYLAHRKSFRQFSNIRGIITLCRSYIREYSREKAANFIFLLLDNASKNHRQSTDALIKIINTNIVTIVRRYLEAVRRKADIQTKFNHRYRQKDYYFFIKEFLFSCHKFSFNHQYIRISLNLFFPEISPIY